LVSSFLPWRPGDVGAERGVAIAAPGEGVDPPRGSAFYFPVLPRVEGRQSSVNAVNSDLSISSGTPATSSRFDLRLISAATPSLAIKENRRESNLPLAMHPGRGRQQLPGRAAPSSPGF